MVLLAGDIGGTKTSLALFDEKGGTKFTHNEKFPSKEFSCLSDIVFKYYEKIGPLKEEIKAACFAIAGPCENGICHATNLPWDASSPVLRQKLNLEQVYCINDLESNAWAIDILDQDQLYQINKGKIKTGNIAVVSPGTGLGEAGMVWTGKRHLPFASEGGHCEFGPRDDEQLELCEYLMHRYGHVSYERILCGAGLVNVYMFFRDYKHYKEDSNVRKEMFDSDPAAVISKHGIDKTDPLCERTLNLFCSIFGSEAGNCALKLMAVGGVFLGGGVSPKILPALKGKYFTQGFFDKGRFEELLRDIPIYVILDPTAALIGAGRYCRVQIGSEEF